MLSLRDRISPRQCLQGSWDIFCLNNTFWNKRWGEPLSRADDIKMGEPVDSLESRGLALRDTPQARAIQQESNEIQKGQMQSLTSGKK